MASFSEELEIYLAEVSGDGYVPPILPGQDFHLCEVICRLLKGDFGPWPNSNLCEPLRRYLRKRRAELGRIEELRVRKIRQKARDDNEPPPFICPSRYVAEERDIRQWLVAGGDPCNIDGLIRACNGVPWYYDFNMCRFTDGTGNPIQEPPLCIPQLPGLPGSIP